MPIFQRNPQIEEAPLQQEVMLFHPGSSQFYMLNSTMAYIWRNCAGASEESLIAGVAEHFEGVDADTAAGDVRKALDDLLSLGVLIDESGASA